MKPNFLDIIRNRHSKRAFLDRPVPKATIDEVLLAARQAPSSKNTQPWGVTVLTGDVKDALSKAICEKFDRNETDPAEYAIMTDPMPDSFLTEARKVGYALFDFKGIDRQDYEARKAHNRENFTFFGAPAVMIFHIRRDSEKGNFFDTGLFVQNVMLGLEALGLGSCPQYSLTSYNKTIRETIDLPDDRLVVCGLSFGFPDPDKAINTFHPGRHALDDFVSYLS